MKKGTNIYRYLSMSIILVILLTRTIAFAQTNDCVIKLKDAEKLYENGLIEKIPPLLGPCIKKGLKKDDQLQAIKLVIQSYLFDDKYEKADSMMTLLLKIEPEYQPNPLVDPPEFITLYKSYRTMPIFSLSVNLGGNFTDVKLIEPFGVGNIESNPGTYSPGFGYNIGISAEKYFMERLEGSVGLRICRNKFRKEDKPLAFTKTTFEETQTRLELPVFANFDVLIKDIKPFVTAGFIFTYNMNDFADVERIYTDNSHNDETGSEIKLLESRNTVNLWLGAGLGVKYKIDAGMLSFRSRYNVGMFNQTIEENRFSHNELLYKYYYVDDDFRVNFFEFIFSFSYPLYKPQKIGSE